MFTIYVVPPDIETSLNPTPALSSTNPGQSSPSYSHVDDNCTKKQRSTYSPLIRTLQNSIFFGGFGSLTREIEAMENQIAAEALARSSTKTDILLPNLPEKQMTVGPARSYGSDAIASMPLKRYKITVEELSGVVHDGVVSNDNNIKGNNEALAERVEPLVVSTTAVMPSNVMNWLLSVTQRGRESIVDTQATSQPVEDVRKPTSDNKASLLATATVSDASRKAKEEISSNQRGSTTINHDFAVATAAATAAMLGSPQGKNGNNVEIRQENETHVVINKTTITRPDGTVETKSMILNRETGMTETHTHIRHANGSVQESVRCESKPILSPLVPLPSGTRPAEQERDSIPKGETDYDNPSLLSIRERWAQRRQERVERREELREERQRARQDRRQELREAEAKQREATAAAYGFVYPSTAAATNVQDIPSSKIGHNDNERKQVPEANNDAVRGRHYHEGPYRSAWHQRREERRQEMEK
ncbi:hypothetical protein BGZ65_009227 [Modicella reniformis]|uniref:Uncharacterized protein n=1 Tax=Modicella reniformis TaxID=1440133 RepID=A0A9P6LRL8_9FUNG|nr:hypothetical protein BGZ65_009227 [Modicella reniformis]